MDNAEDNYVGINLKLEDCNKKISGKVSMKFKEKVKRMFNTEVLLRQNPEIKMQKGWDGSVPSSMHTRILKKE